MFAMEISRLIERCRQGDAEALGNLYVAYAHRMRGVCRRYLSDEQAISDVLHDSFVIIFTSFDKLRDDSKAEAWMMSITRNVASKYKEYQEIHRMVPLDSVNEAELPADDIPEKNVRGIPLSEVSQLVDKLPEGYGQVFRLAVFEGMSHKEIATLLGIEPHSSSSQLARAKKMLRKMMRQYWAVPLLLFVSLVFFLLKQRGSVVEEEKPLASKQRQTPGKPQSVVSQQASTPDESTLQAVAASPDIAQPVGANLSDSIASDTLPTMMAQETSIGLQPLFSETVATDSSLFILHSSLPNLPNQQRSTSRRWHLAMAYASTPTADMGRTDNYMTMPSFTSAATQAAKIYNWADYMNYAIQNANKLDSTDASNIGRIALANAGNPWEPITEIKHHERPKTWQISLSKQLDDRWTLSTGLGYTYMKSTFEAGNERTLIRRTQRLHYVGLPLQLTYRIVGNHRWTLFTSAGVRLDIPVRSCLTTQYLYNGSAKSEYPDSLVIPTTHNSIHAPWQWSVGAGAGIQYQIAPHVNVYVGPSLQYFIPTSDEIENYRTAHPLDLSLPFGIRFTW